jgi:hypothetical protein
MWPVKPWYCIPKSDSRIRCVSTRTWNWSVRTVNFDTTRASFCFHVTDMAGREDRVKRSQLPWYRGGGGRVPVDVACWIIGIKYIVSFMGVFMASNYDRHEITIEKRQCWRLCNYSSAVRWLLSLSPQWCGGVQLLLSYLGAMRFSTDH